MTLNQIPYMIRMNVGSESKLSLGICASWFSSSADTDNAAELDRALDGQLKSLLHEQSAANGYFSLMALRSGRFAA